MPPPPTTPFKILTPLFHNQTHTLPVPQPTERCACYLRKYVGIDQCKAAPAAGPCTRESELKATASASGYMYCVSCLEANCQDLESELAAITAAAIQEWREDGREVHLQGLGHKEGDNNDASMTMATDETASAAEKEKEIREIQEAYMAFLIRRAGSYFVPCPIDPYSPALEWEWEGGESWTEKPQAPQRSPRMGCEGEPGGGVE